MESEKGGSMQNKKIGSKRILDAVSAAAAVALLYALMFSFGITCPIKYVTGVSCAGCGMTRAWLSFLRLDIAGAFAYHPLFFLPPFMLGAYLCRAKIPKKIYAFFMLTSVLLFVSVYGYRMLRSDGTVVAFHPKEGLAYRLIVKRLFHSLKAGL